ncbi:CHY zinc finger domain-containing protein [Phlyctema vagabunda]|uniref:CHY zinc finger domain-containing protein n=1 Tax=Phlyctema vagabunda TaxID=108571 RepID=A0ABR4PEJ6_9HELO
MASSLVSTPTKGLPLPLPPTPPTSSEYQNIRAQSDNNSNKNNPREAEPASRAAAAPHAKPSRICYYYSKRGKCRDGDNCRFIHDRDSPVENATTGSTITTTTTISSSSLVPDERGMVPDRRQAVTKSVPASRVVQKPVPDQDPREFQLGQIRRRFSPKESLQKASAQWDTEEGSLLQFKLPPSDPDFPFEMTALECSLLVPTHYPESRPMLKVENKDIPRGFAINVEHGFNELAQEKAASTLLELIKALDKNLEVFLSAQKADTVKIVVPNKKDTRHLANLPIRAVEPVSSPQQNPGPSSPPKPAAPIKYEPIFTKAQKADALKRREAETRQLEARMGRLPLFKKSGDGIAYTIPIEPKRRSELPVALQAVKAIQLFVPLIYPLQSCRVQLEGVEASEGKSVAKGFEVKAAEQKEATLMGHVNYLAQNMHTLAKTVIEEKEPVQPIVANPVEFPDTKKTEGNQDPERGHVQYIARPPEWTMVETSDAEESDDDYSYDSGDESTSDEEEKVEVDELKLKDSQFVSNPERGTAISFPFMELYGIGLLEVVTLNITVKCDRCKDITEVRGLKDGVAKSESCKKCASALSISFRRDLLHANAVRAGFLDLEGCIIGDMLPSSFVPTCSRCSTSYPLPGIVSVQGETTPNVCRECHQKFTFKLPSVKFLRITSTSSRAPTSGPRRKKEVLGLVAGTELPKRGRCRHYAKSYRWFRFSCCQKVYACDKCHDEDEEHPHEWANRMICGWCSREGNYRPEDCAVCHQTLVGKRGGGFWEGGKGTRDKVKMSRKDKRKHRRIGGTAKKN